MDGHLKLWPIINAALLRPLVVESPHELVSCYSKDTQRPDTYRAFLIPITAIARKQ